MKCVWSQQKNSRKIAATLLLSFAIHIAGFAVLLLGFAPAIQTEAPKFPTETAFEVELLHSGSLGNTVREQRPPAVTQPKLNLGFQNDITERHAEKLTARQAGEVAVDSASRARNGSGNAEPPVSSASKDFSRSAEGSDFVDDPRAEWGSGGADFGRVADIMRFDRLYRMVDSRLHYPSILAYRGMSGTVNAHLVITKQGCDWHHTRITASEPHFRVYILDVLKRVCGENMSSFARKDRASNVDFSFTFAQTEHNDQALIDQQRKIVGNVLLFYRNSHSSVAEWKLGPIRGLFPVPAVSVDFTWLQLNWDKFVGKADPMAEFTEKPKPEPAS